MSKKAPHPPECICSVCLALKVFEELKCIHRDMIRVLHWIALKEIDFVQVGGLMNIVRGAGGTFQAVLTPTNGAQAAGTSPQWGADDPSIVLTPSSDGTSCQANAPTGSTVTSFNLSVKATSSDPTVGAAGVVTATHPVTVSEPTPPPPTALQSIDFVQTAG